MGSESKSEDFGAESAEVINGLTHDGNVGEHREGRHQATEYKRSRTVFIEH